MTDNAKVNPAPKRSKRIRQNQKQNFLERRQQETKEELEQLKKTLNRRNNRNRVTAFKRGEKIERADTFVRGTHREVEMWIENHYKLTRCFLIPREQRAHVQVHKWDFSIDVAKFFNLTPTDRSFVIAMAPRIPEFLQIGLPGSSVVIPAFGDGSPHETSMDFATDVKTWERGITQDENFDTVAGGSLKAGLVTGADTLGYHYATQTDVKSGCKMYPGAPLNFEKISYYFHNTDSQSITLEVFTLLQQADGQVLTQVVDSPFGSGDIFGSCTAGFSISQWANAIAFGFGFRVVNSATIGRLPSGFRAKIGFFVETTVAETVHWRSFSVWQIISDASGALRSQYERSLFHCFTAMHVTFTNNQSDMYNGGSIQAHQLPGKGRSIIPHTYPAINSFIGSRTFDTLDSKQLKLGLHWNYRWEKVQDTFFITHDREAEDDDLRPSLIATFELPQQQGDNQYGFSLICHGALQLEYITEERDAPTYLSPADTVNLLARYCAIRAEMPCLAHNPSHLKMIASNVKKIMSHPVTKDIISTAAKVGLKLLMV